MADLRDPRLYDDYLAYLAAEGLMAPAPEVVDAWWVGWGFAWDGSEEGKDKG